MSQTRLRKTLLAIALAQACTAVAAGEIDPGLLLSAGRTGATEVLVIGQHQSTPALAPLSSTADALVRRRALVDALRARADADQALIRDWLDRRGIAHRDYWVANVIETRLNASQIEALAQRADVARIAANPVLRQPLPQPQGPVRERAASTSASASVAWGVDRINAPEAWAHGVYGQGTVVAGEDTGYQWDHPALIEQYRGWNGASADHDYNWHDAIHDDTHGSSCGVDAAAPCDDFGHGTHTMGTMVGDDGGSNQVGIAPQAKWIGCRNMDAGWGTPARYIECMQWMLAPTDMSDANPDVAKAPDVINNSWACVPEEGCTVGNEIRSAVDNVIAGGIFFAAAAGNEANDPNNGSAALCDTIINPPATYAESFTIAAVDSSDALARFSSRGPSPGVSEPALDIAAPGVSVPSSVPVDAYANYSGTSMASPHVAGTVALMISVNPALRGHPDQVAAILRETAVRTGITDPYNSGCGGLSMNDWPNYQAGYGRLDAWAAVRVADTLFADGLE